jgi:plasmid stabilization system protein ParE
MIHVLPAPLPLATVLAWREHERDHILRYGAALAQERAARRAVESWRETYANTRARMKGMNPHDAQRLHDALRDAEQTATEAHEAAMAELRLVVTPFTILSEAMSRACGA